MKSDTILCKLRELVSSVDANQIEKTLAEAEELQLTETEDFKSLQQHAIALTEQISLTAAMSKALKEDDLEQLTACLAKVKKSGLAKNPESWLIGLNGAALASQVFDNIERLKEKMKVDGMRQEQQSAVQAALFTKKTEDFQMKMSTDAEKEKRPDKVEEDKEICLTKLQDAAAEYDAKSLEQLITQGYKQGIAKEELSVFRELYSMLKTEDFLQKEIARCEEALQSEDFEEVVVKQFRYLSQQLARITGDELFVEDAEKTIRSKVKRLSGIPEVDEAEEDHELPVELFQLVNFPKLKKYFSGHRGSFFARLSRNTGRGNMEKMVSHSFDELREGLTSLPAEHEQRALQMFRDILAWMGDSSVVESRRLSDSSAIVAIAQAYDALQDEVYCQVIKQLTDNPSHGSIGFGWKLMLLLCQEIAPSKDLYKFVRFFIIAQLRELRSVGGELLVIVRQCLSDINKHTYHVEENPLEEEKAFRREDFVIEDESKETTTISAPSGNTASLGKSQTNYLEAANGEESVIDIIVILMDYSTRKIRISDSSSLFVLGEKLAAELRLENMQDFSFFQLIVGSSETADVQRCVGNTMKTNDVSEVPRLLPTKTVIKKLLTKWDNLKRMSGKSSYFLFKRCFIREDEELRTKNMSHATLTYRQAIWDYLHYPIYESSDTVVRIAAALLGVDRNDYDNILKDRDISGKGVLEQVVPEHILKYDTDRLKWSRTILQKLSELDIEQLFSESRMTKMSRFLELCQTTKMFGCQYWHVEQCSSPESKRAIENLPSSSLKVNPKEPFGEYWIIVNTKGVSFVPFDGAPGEHILRTFEFRSGSRDQLMRWGHHADLLQLVVVTVDPTSISSGQVEMSMSFRSRQAVDCAFAIQVAKGMHSDKA